MLEAFTPVFHRVFPSSVLVELPWLICDSGFKLNGDAKFLPKRTRVFTMHAHRYLLATLATLLALWPLTPTWAKELGAQVEHLNGDQYSVSAWIPGNPGTKSQLQESSQTNQTMNFELVVTQDPHYHGRTATMSHSRIDVTVPADIEEICVRFGAESVMLDLHKHPFEAATGQVIQRAIDHGDALEFSYQNKKLVAWPRLLYRAAGDTHGLIVQCATPAEGDPQRTRCFYVRSIADVAVKYVR
jgi:hypothetical protein